MKKFNSKVAVALLASCCLSSSYAFGANTTWNIVSSNLSNGGQISGSFVWDPITPGTNGGSGTMISNNIILTINGTPYNNLVMGSFAGNYIRLMVSNTVSDNGLFFGSSALATPASNISGNAGFGSCITVNSGLCDFLGIAGIGTIVLSAVLGPSSTNTIEAIIVNRLSLQSLLSQRSSAIMSMMDYDCETFDAKGYCLSFRARYSAMDSQNEGAGVFTAAYRASEKVRIGTFLDYRASEKDSTGLKQGDTMPTIGAFAAYSHTGNATGLQAKASAAYNSGKVTVTRKNSLSDTEPGSGKTALNSYAIGAELAWGFAVSPTMLATPYAGIRYSDVTRKGYSEGTVAGLVEFPISYDAYYQRQTAATAGVRLTGMLTEKVGYQVALGGEYDLAHKANAYSGTSTIPDLETFALANSGSSNRARVVASTGLYYQMDKTQRLTANVGVRGQAYSSQPSVTTLVGYQVAF